MNTEHTIYFFDMKQVTWYLWNLQIWPSDFYQSMSKAIYVSIQFFIIYVPGMHLLILSYAHGIQNS